MQDEYAGMMGALTDIQMKGDSMLAGIRMQKEMLDTLERNLEKTEERMKEAEKKTEVLEERKVELEADVLELHDMKSKMEEEMNKEKEEIIR